MFFVVWECFWWRGRGEGVGSGIGRWSFDQEALLKDFRAVL